MDVWVSWRSNGRKETSRVRDLSLGGLFVETAKSTGVGASVKLYFLVQEGPIGAEAVVRHDGAKPSSLERTRVTPRTEDRGPIKSP